MKVLSAPRQVIKRHWSPENYPSMVLSVGMKSKILLVIVDSVQPPGTVMILTPIVWWTYGDSIEEMANVL